MEDRKDKQIVQQVFDSSLSGIQDDPWMAQRVLSKAHEAPGTGGFIVKKKISVGFVFIMILILTMATALAIGLSNYFDSFASLEDSYGEYEQWPDSAKVQLVEVMYESGVLSEEESSMWGEKLSDVDKEHTAEVILEKHFAGMTYVDTYNAMTRELGPIEEWTEEERALYTSILQKYGKQQADWPVYVIPGNHDLSRDEAVARAREATLAMFSVSPQELDHMPIDAIFSVDAYNTVGAPVNEPFWQVMFGYGGAYRVYMTRNGEMLGIEGPHTQYYFWGSELTHNATPATPGPHDITHEQAIAEANNALTEIMNVSHEEINAMDATTQFLYSDWYCRGDEPVWLVSLSKKGVVQWNVLLGYDGSYIDAEPGGKMFDNVSRSYTSLADMWRERCGELGMTEHFQNANGEYYYRWTLEEKAAFYQMWRPIADAFEAENPYCHEEGSGIWEYTRNASSIPDEKAISQRDAAEIAVQAFDELGTEVSIEELSVFYYITDPLNPEWRFATPNCFVIVHAYTGEVLFAQNGVAGDRDLVTIADFLSMVLDHE